LGQGIFADEKERGMVYAAGDINVAGDEVRIGSSCRDSKDTVVFCGYAWRRISLTPDQ